MKRETEQLGRVADRALWSVQVAESIQDVVRVVLDNNQGRPYAHVRAALESTLGELVAKYQRAEALAVSEFTDAIRDRIAAEVRS